MQMIQPVILCGGSGTRLWPLSRGLYPKQFMDIGGDTLFAKTVERSIALEQGLPPIVIGNNEHRFLAAAILQEQSRRRGLEKAGKAAILLEPQARNTAPAIAMGALAALDLASQNGHSDPLLLVLSSDHVIAPQSAFASSVSVAAKGAEKGCLVVFGVPPTRPETGFGYIVPGETLFPGVSRVARFVEKPSHERAEAMLKEGGVCWNSGMFLFKASVFLEELERHAPEVNAACRETWEKKQRDLDFYRLPEDSFSKNPSISIDYAIMEKTDRACMVPLEASWDDMGSWEAFYINAPKDTDNNALQGDVIQLESRDCYLHSSHRLVAALGLENICIVETPDAVLALPRERNQDVKLLLEELKRRGRPESNTHLRVYRPWGSYETLVLGDRFQVKRIIVKPGGILSLQLHYHRAEHWVVVRGAAKVTLGDSDVMLHEDQSTYIPLNTRHRLENPGKIPLELIEIQTGSYLGEDDIVRFEDRYGRP